MKTSSKITVQEDLFKISIDVFEAVWGYLLYDNISILADSKSNILRLYSFATGKEQTSTDISKDNIEELTKNPTIELNYSLGDNNTAIFKKEAIDVTGKFIEAIEAQFKGRISTAIECYKAVLEANPNNYRAFGLLGRCFRSEGKNDEAYECYKKAIELAPNSPEAYCNLGVLFQKEGDEEKAQAAYLQAIELDNFYCNALVKRAAWLLKNNPDDYELKLYNLRLSAVHQDVTSAQTHLKNYYELMNFDRTAYSDKETALFGDFADYKLQKKLKIIESCINNGAYAAALNNMKEVLESTKGTSAENRVAGWCNGRAKRSSKRLGDKLDFDVWKAFNNIAETTPTEEDMSKQAEEASRKEALEEAMKFDRKAAEAESKAAIAEMENKISEDGDYAQPIAGPIEKEVTEDERDEALAEQSLLGGEDDVPTPDSVTVSEEPMMTRVEEVSAPKPVTPKPTPEPTPEPESDSEVDLMASIDDVPPPPPISEESMLTGVDDIPAPGPATPEPVLEPPSTDNLMAGTDNVPPPPPIPEEPKLVQVNEVSKPIASEPALKPISTDDLMAGVDDVPPPPPISEESMLTGMDDIPAPKPAGSMSFKEPPVKPVSTDDLMAGIDNTPAPGLKPMSTAELMSEASTTDITEPESSLKPKSTAELLSEAKDMNNSVEEPEPLLKPKSTAELMAEAKDMNGSVDEPETLLKPMSTAELMAQANNIDISVPPSEETASYLQPKSTAELMAEAKNVVLPPEPVLDSQPEEKAKNADNNVSLNKDYKSPVKGVNPVTIQEFFMLVLVEVMRDGVIEDAEKRFLENLKKFLKISDEDYNKMYNHVLKQIALKGKLDKGESGKFNPKRVFRNLCKAALRDGVLQDSEKKILIAASKLFKISEKEFKTMLLEAKK